MPFNPGDLVDLVPFPVDPTARTAELVKRQNSWPGWAEDMTDTVDNTPTNWQIVRARNTDRSSYEILHIPSGKVNLRSWSEAWLVPTKREPYTVGQMLKALSR